MSRVDADGRATPGEGGSPDTAGASPSAITAGDAGRRAGGRVQARPDETSIKWKFYMGFQMEPEPLKR